MTVVEVVLVPAAEDMDDDTLCRHINARHIGEIGGVPLYLDGAMRSGTLATVDAYRAFHARLHALATPEQHDHDHDDPSASD